MTRLIIDTPTGSNLDPALRDTIDEAGLEARDFRVLGAVLRWAGRRGSYRASVEALARTCQMSESSARRGLQALVEGGWLDALTRTGRTTEYQPTTRLHWDGGLAFFVPGPLDDLGLTPLEWRAYYHCVRRADATGLCTLNISDAARACRTNRERFAERLLCLTACGLLRQTDKHAYQLTPRTTWATSETLPLIRDALSRGDTPPCPETTPPLSRDDTPPLSRGDTHG